MRDKHVNQQPSRRNFLRGAGVALALPWLESFPLQAAATAGSQVDPNKPPVRFGLVYFSNGVEPEHWWAKGQGAAMEIGPGLTPMEKLKTDMCFIKGLFNEQAVLSSSPHLGRMPNMLSGATVSLDPADIRCGETMDQVMAKRIGDRTRVPSLVLGIEPNELRLEDGVSMIYGSCISWATATKPATKEIYPARAFDQLVGDGKGRQLDRSILDAVLEQAHGLSGKVSRNDGRKIDEYLESVRDIEKRIERASKEERLEGWPHSREAQHGASRDRPAAGHSHPHEAHARPRRAGLPDGQDAHRHADAQQRLVSDELRLYPGRRRRLCTSTSRTTAMRPSSRRCTCAPTSTTSANTPISSSA
ncbi:MAG: DUF1552 domain-containing protein [Bryobacterales bacterium]